MYSGLASEKGGGKPLHSRVGLVLAKPHGDETISGEIGVAKNFRGRSFGAEKGFSSQITATHGAFHGGGPAGIGPVTG